MKFALTRPVAPLLNAFCSDHAIDIPYHIVYFTFFPFMKAFPMAGSKLDGPRYMSTSAPM